MTAVLAAVNERMRSRLTGNIGDGVRQLPPDEQREGDDGGREQAEDGRRGPAPVVALHQGQREHEEADARDEMPGMSRPPSAGVLAVPGMTMPQATSAKMPTGTLTKKIQDQ